MLSRRPSFVAIERLPASGRPAPAGGGDCFPCARTRGDRLDGSRDRRPSRGLGWDDLAKIEKGHRQAGDALKKLKDSAVKQARDIEAGGTVLAETFVKITAEAALFFAAIACTLPLRLPGLPERPARRVITYTLAPLNQIRAPVQKVTPEKRAGKPILRSPRLGEGREGNIDFPRVETARRNCRLLAHGELCDGDHRQSWSVYVDSQI